MKKARFFFKSILVIAIILLLFSGCGDSQRSYELSVDDIYELLGASRSEVHKKLNFQSSDIEYPFSKEEDPLKQVERSTVPRTVESKACQIQLHYNEDEILDQFQCNFIFDPISNNRQKELWEWAVKIADKLDEKWKEEEGPLGNGFHTDKVPDFSQPINKTRQWVVNKSKFYSFSFAADPSFQGNSTVVIIFS